MAVIKQLITFLLICYVEMIQARLKLGFKFENTFLVYQKLEQMIKLCLPTYLNPVVVTGNVGQHLHLSSNLYDSLSIILVNNEFLPNNNNKQQWYPRRATFIITVDIQDQNLKHYFSILNSSPWWNVKSFFIFVKMNSCDGAEEALKIAWEKQLLSSLFLCHQTRNDTVKLYTYNPFTNHAPDPWKISKDVDNLHQRWTLYEQPFQSDPQICKNLVFDKLKEMDGYHIKMIGIPIPGSKWAINETYSISSLTTHLPFYNGIFYQTLFSVWNVTPIIKYDDLGTLVNGNVIGFLQGFMTGVYDLSYTVFRIDEAYNWSVAYPFRQLSVMIQTRKENFLTTEQKILSFYSFWILVLTIIVCIISIGFLIFDKSQEFTAAMLEIFRLLVYCSMQHSLIHHSTRVYFFGVFWLIIILNATFTGHLATFLTKPERPSVETIQELEMKKYHTYIETTLHDMVGGQLQVLGDHLHEIEFLDCHQYVVKNHHTACVALTSRGYKPAYQYQLHVSKPLLPTYRSFIGSLDSPFIEKVNKISSLFIQSGLQAYWDHHASHYFIQNLTATEDLETSPRYRPIKGEDIFFAFKLLFIGLSVSLGIFMAELCIEGWEKSKIRRKKKQRKVRINNWK